MKRIQHILAFALIAALLIGLVPLVEGGPTAAAFTPAHSVIRIGINAHLSWSPTPSLILQNTSGLRVGSYNAARQFVPSGSAVHNTLHISASGTTVTIRTPAGDTVHSGTGTVALHPLNETQTSTYTLPNPAAGRHSFNFFGGFRFSAAGGNLTIVNYVDLEDYLKGVVPYEMPASWPIEALKAQAVAARTFAARHFNRRNSHGFDLANSVSDQVYRGQHGANANTNRSVTDTRGQVILHNGQLIGGYYHSTSGGATENSENVWTAALPYLRGVQSPYSVLASVRWSRTLTPEEFRTHMRSRDSGFNLVDIADVTTELTAMGNMFAVTFTSSTGQTRVYRRGDTRTRVNSGLHPTFNSQRFTITRNEANLALAADITEATDLYTLNDLYPYYSQIEIMELADAGKIQLHTGSAEAIESLSTGGVTYTITNYGFGHNVGMSQWGALRKAEAGRTFDQILRFYYTGVTITGVTNPQPVGFTDVQPDRWFYPWVNYVNEHRLMTGVGSNRFAPDRHTTRAEFVAILARMMNINTMDYVLGGTVNGSLVNLRSGPGIGHSVMRTLPRGTAVTIIGRSGDWLRVRHENTTGYMLGSFIAAQQGAFNDLTPGAWYVPYVEWAYRNNIASGIGQGRFGPNNTLPRQGMAYMLYNAARAMGVALQNNNVPEFHDINTVADWARPAVRAMQRADVIRGTGAGNFNPHGLTNRAEVASLIANFHQRYVD